MPRSSARFVSYDIRPSKQIERLIFVDQMRSISAFLPDMSDYAYVGLGANRFYDFQLIYKYLGVKNMVSLEHDLHMYKRAEYNCPFKFIEVRNENLSSFIGLYQKLTPHIFWLDYDDSLRSTKLQEITSFSRKCESGDFLFVTIPGHAPSHLARKTDSEKLNWLKENFNPMAGSLVIDDMEERNFSKTILKILEAAFKFAFSSKSGGVFCPMMSLIYSDTTEMVTYGGIFLESGKHEQIKECLSKKYPFLYAGHLPIFEIPNFALTDKERKLFDRACTTSNTKSYERRILKSFGFKNEEVEIYRNLMRFIPKYIETIF